ncbi:hypothetical protein [Providencia rettgeri]|uniref:hypothetical protein n=1 Tax=Providencia rettgeri TaxID=587 RepID=UPI00352539B3
MMRKLFLIAILLLPAFSGYAQFISGAFRSDIPRSGNNLDFIVNGSLFQAGNAFYSFPNAKISGNGLGNVTATLYYYPVSFSGGVVKFRSSPNNPIGASNTGTCYIRGYSSFYYQSTAVFNSNDSLFQGTEIKTGGVISDNYIKIDKSCSSLTTNSPEITNLQIPIPPFYGSMLKTQYSLLGSSAGIFQVNSGPPLYQDLTFALNMLNSNAGLRLSIMVLACGGNDVNSSSCNTTPAIGGNSITPATPTAVCQFSVPSEITIDDVSANDYLGKKSSVGIVSQCDSTGSVNFTIPNNGIVNVGPFQVQTKFDDKINPTLSIGENTNVIFSAEIVGTNQNITAGEYTGVALMVIAMY